MIVFIFHHHFNTTIAQWVSRRTLPKSLPMGASYPFNAFLHPHTYSEGPFWMNLNKSEPFKYYISNWSFQLQGVAGGGGGGRKVFLIFPPPPNTPDLKTGSSQPKRSKISPKQWFSTISILKQADVPLPPWFNPLCNVVLFKLFEI